MLSVNQVIIPLAAVGAFDDDEFTVGTPDQWCTAFAAQVVASRANGTVVRGRIYVALDVAQRMFGASMPEIGEWNSPLSIQIFGPDFERINVLCDLSLADSTVRIE